MCQSKKTLCYSTRQWESHLADPVCLTYLLIFKYQILFVATIIDLMQDASFSQLILIVLVLFCLYSDWSTAQSQHIVWQFQNREFFCLIGYILFVWFPEPVRKPQVIGRHVAEWYSCFRLNLYLLKSYGYFFPYLSRYGGTLKI